MAIQEQTKVHCTLSTKASKRHAIHFKCKFIQEVVVQYSPFKMMNIVPTHLGSLNSVI